MRALISTGCFLLLAACASRPGPTGDLAQTAAPSLEPAAVSRSQGEPNGGTSPAWSPDGTKIAFLSATPHTPADLWLMNADGTGAKRLTTQGIRGFRWADDGTTLWAVGRRKGLDEVFRVDPAGGGIQKAPGLPFNASLPVYAPDGQLFAVTVPGKDRVRDLWIGTADGARLEAVTEKIGVRNLFWGPDSRRIFYEAGESYGVGIWEFDLATMESRVLLSKYIGTPVYSPQSDRIAYPYPVRPGEFDVHVMALDGSNPQQYEAPRLDGRWLAWDAAGTGVYYLGQEVVAKSAGDKTDAPEAEKPSALHDPSAASDFQQVGVVSLWHLDFATGQERRVSPDTLHLADFSLSADGKQALVTGVLPESVAAELFRLDLASGEMVKLASSRPSFWMPVPSRDSASIAFFTNEPGSDTLLVVDAQGEVQAAYGGLTLERGIRLFRLPESDALALFSSRGLFAFTGDRPVEFPDQKDHRAFLYADVSVQNDRVLLSSIPRFGETPGLYMLEAVGGKFVQADLRFPPVEEIVPEVYLQPKWSFDGQKIAFSDRVDIWTMKAEGVGRTWITDYATRNWEKTGPPATASHPIWSVSGDKICYTLTVYEGETVSRQLWLVNADGSEPKMLYSEVVDSEFQLYLPEFTNQPFFDIHDERVIFTGAEGGLPNLFAIEIESGRLHRLTENGAIFPALLPEEDLIIYTSLEGNEERLWVMNSHGTQKRPFEIKARPADPAADAEAAKGAETGAKEAPPAEAAPAGVTGK